MFYVLRFTLVLHLGDGTGHPRRGGGARPLLWPAIEPGVLGDSAILNDPLPDSRRYNPINDRGPVVRVLRRAPACRWVKPSDSHAEAV